MHGRICNWISPSPEILKFCYYFTFFGMASNSLSCCVLGKKDLKMSSHLDFFIPTCFVACSNFLQNSGLHTASCYICPATVRMRWKKAEIGVGGNSLHISVKTWMFIYQSRHFFGIPDSSRLRCN